MNANWLDILQTTAIQHLWQSALLFVVTTALLKVCPLKSGARSWVWLCVLTLAAVLPLAVFAPGSMDTRELPFVSALPFTTATDDAVVMGNSPVVHPPALPTASASRVHWPDVRDVLTEAGLFIWSLGFLWHLRALYLAWRSAQALRSGATDMARLDILMRTEFAVDVRLKACDGIATPMVVGLLRPCVLIPRALATSLSDANLVDVLGHEIAHIRRGDIWTSTAQRLLTAIYWWSPALKLIGARLDLAREMACDEHAAMRTGKPKAYASSLLTCIEIIARPERHDLLGSPMFGSRKALTQRVNALLEMDVKARKTGTFTASIFWGASMIAVASVTFAATPRVASTGANEVWSGPVAREAALKPETVRSLLEAVQAGRVDVVRTLIRHGADVNAGIDGDGTALIVAARNGNLEMLEALLRMNAKPDLAWPGDASPLIAAISSGKLAVVERLVAAGANLNASSAYDETPLINAARAGRLDIVQYLVEHGASVTLGVWADGQRWRTPLNQAHGAPVKAYLRSKMAK